jgi:tetratricopeptide (TPR) repeat protein
MRPENQEKLKLIAELREQSGKEEKTLEETNKLLSICDDDPECAARLWWEKALTYQHLVMRNIDPEENKEKMSETTTKAHEIIEDNCLEDLRGEDFRFLGRVADYNGKYKEAKDYYERALEIFRGKPRELEIKGFLATTLVNLGDVEKGIELVKKTFGEYDENTLKKEDYFTWAVWKSGLWMRIIKILVEKNIPFDREEMKKCLNASEEILKDPQEEKTLGNKNFQYRIDEIEETKKMLQN